MPAPKTASRQPRFANTQEELSSWVITSWQSTADGPAWGEPGRTAWLRAFARTEPILAGAHASMVSKVVSLDYQISGGRNRVLRQQELLANESENGAGWTVLVDRWAQDYLATDIGGVVELGRESRNGPVVGLYNLDAETLTLTGSAVYPLRYTPVVTGVATLSSRTIPLRPQDFSRIVDMPATDESKHTLGFCSVSRAVKAAKILLALYNYEDEKLSDMPLPGIVSVTGMTMNEVKSAFDLYEAKRKSREQLTFKNVLWLAAQTSPVNPITVNLTSFASLPEAFDKMQTVSLYVYTLALDFGVDVREFWPASQTGATKGEAEVQSQKAKGKGFGRMLAAIERALNWDVFPEGLEFRFDQKDSEDDLMRETIRAQAATSVRKLWEPTQTGAGIITTDEARRILVEDGVLPSWLSDQAETTVSGQSNTEDVGRIAKRVQTKENALLEARVAKAALLPGEDLVAVNKQGEVVTLWRNRSVYLVTDWPLPRRKELTDGLQTGQGQEEETQAVNEYLTFAKAAAEHRRAAQLLGGDDA